MGRLSKETILTAVQLHRNGLKYTEIVGHFASEGCYIDRSTVMRAVKRFEANGVCTPQPRKRKDTVVTPAQHKFIGRYFSNPDHWRTSNKEIYRKLREQLDFRGCYSTYLNHKKSFDFVSGPMRIVPLIR